MALTPMDPSFYSHLKRFNLGLGRTAVIKLASLKIPRWVALFRRNRGIAGEVGINRFPPR